MTDEYTWSNWEEGPKPIPLEDLLKLVNEINENYGIPIRRRGPNSPPLIEFPDEVPDRTYTRSPITGPFHNMRVIESKWIPTVTVQARRHKRKSSRRWQKKWLKRFGTKQVSKALVLDGHTLVVNGPMKSAFKKILDEIGDRMTNSYEYGLLRLGMFEKIKEDNR